MRRILLSDRKVFLARAGEFDLDEGAALVLLEGLVFRRCLEISLAGFVFLICLPFYAAGGLLAGFLNGTWRSLRGQPALGADVASRDGAMGADPQRAIEFRFEHAIGAYEKVIDDAVRRLA